MVKCKLPLNNISDTFTATAKKAIKNLLDICILSELLRRIIGDLSDREKVLVELDIIEI